LIALTEEGRRRFRLIRKRETELLADVAPSVSHAELAAATRLFDVLERELARRSSDFELAAG
jgi:DNA-binding PadR family transcriptional regulator